MGFCNILQKQRISYPENSLLVEYWLTEHPDGVALTSGRRQCLSVGHYGASERKVLVVRMDVANWWASGREHHIVRTVSWDTTSLSWNLHRIFLEHYENWNWLLKIKCVQQVSTKIKHSGKWKTHSFCSRSGNSIKRKTTLGQPNPGIPLFRRRS